jgi:hypothetical protein
LSRPPTGVVAGWSGQMAPRVAGRAVRDRGRRRDRIGTRGGGIQVPDQLLHLAGDGARPVRAGRLRWQLASAMARPRVPRADPGGGRPGLRTADLPVRLPNPLLGYQVVEIHLEADSPAAGRPLGAIRWPDHAFPVSIQRGRRLDDPDPATMLADGDRINVLAPAPARHGPSAATIGGPTDRPKQPRFG